MSYEYETIIDILFSYSKMKLGSEVYFFLNSNSIIKCNK